MLVHEASCAFALGLQIPSMTSCAYTCTCIYMHVYTCTCMYSTVHAVRGVACPALVATVGGGEEDIGTDREAVIY